ncbi:MAG: VIT1/CCC1 family protein [Christensenellales bacterium]
MLKQISPELKQRILQFQKDEITGSALYAYMAGRQKTQASKDTLLRISQAEKSHYALWRGYTGQEVAPDRPRLLLFKVIRGLLGDTFAIKLFEKLEGHGIEDLQSISSEIPEARALIAEEEEHEDALLEVLDEERLHYVGAMVLGLNDALVELTGTIAGLTFALGNTRLVALSGIITGVSATLSMAASNYLVERANGSSKALKSSLYTGAAYLVTVILLVLPYLLLPNRLYALAFAVMIAIVILIIMAFNYYIALAKSEPFGRRFLEMAGISLGVAAVSFLIGLAAKALLGIDV